MTGLSRSATEAVIALRDEIESLMLDAAPALSEPLREAGSALSSFLGRAGSDDAMLGDLDASRAALDRARASVPIELRDSDGALLEEAEKLIADVRRRTLDHLASGAKLGPRVSVTPFVASTGVAALVEAPYMPPPEILARPRPWDADPEPAAEERAPRLPPGSDPLARQDLDSLGRSAIEDVAILGGLRRLSNHEPWSDARDFEQRLLANLDALWSLDRPKNPALPPLVVPLTAWRYATEWAVPDWGRSFALALTLGCARGPGPLRWVVLAMLRAPPGLLGAFVDGLALASSHDIDAAVFDLIRDAPPEVTAAGLEIIARRRTFAAGVVVPLLAHPEERVVLAAVACLRHARRELAIEALEALRDAPSTAVQMAALRELCAHGDARARNQLRVILSDACSAKRPEEDGQEALRLLALLGELADAERVLAAALRLPDSAHWLGYFGCKDHVEPMFAELHRAREAGGGSHDRRIRLERAITRLSGVDASGDLEQARKQVRHALESFDKRRVRLGRPHDRKQVLVELAHPKTTQGDRRELGLELAVCWPQEARLEIDTWFARQNADLTAWLAEESA